MTQKDTESPEEPENLHEDLATHCEGKLTLENIVDSTGEFGHLNELVILHIGKCGGYSGAEQYLKTVAPILDLLEGEIRVRYTEGTTRAGMKQVIHDWIDNEIRELR